jgi:hypothetical protein
MSFGRVQRLVAEGEADIVGPADEVEWLAPEQLPGLIRIVYANAVGGQPDDWRHLDSLVASERHTAVLVRIGRIYGGRP